MEKIRTDLNIQVIEGLNGRRKRILNEAKMQYGNRE